MFNFNVFAKALVDSNLSDGEFRLLCLILNNMALNNKEEIEMYNAFVAFHLDKCEKSVQNLMKGLSEKNYITREIIGTSKNRRGNIIMINETMQEMMMEKNYTLYNDYMERKNFPDNEETKQEKNCTLYNDYIKNNKSILINSEKSIEVNIDCIDLDEASNESDTSTNDVSNEENNKTISIDSITSTEGSKPIETQTPSTNDESNTSINVSINESNKPISADETIKWLNSKLDEYYKTKRPNQSQSIEINITNYFQSIDKHNFNPNQLRAISALEKRFNGIKSQKQKYFSKWNKTNTSINSNDTPTPSSAQPLPQESAHKKQKKTKIKEYQDWYLKVIPNFIEGYNFDKDGLENSIKEKLENEFGKEWWLSSDQNAIDIAISIENELMKDLDYFANVSWPNAVKEKEEELRRAELRDQNSTKPLNNDDFIDDDLPF